MRGAIFSCIQMHLVDTCSRPQSLVDRNTVWADLVKTRIAQSENLILDSLWKDVVERSKKLAVAVEAPRQDNTRVEATVIAALRLGDVRKVLQLLNSAPIAPKTEATLKVLKALHPPGPNPAPVLAPKFSGGMWLKECRLH